MKKFLTLALVIIMALICTACANAAADSEASVAQPELKYGRYYLNGDVNSKHIISIVGTRNATPYGQDMTRKIVSEICHEIPDIIVVSGLAYGIDIYAHRATLENGAKTIAVIRLSATVFHNVVSSFMFRDQICI